MRVSCGALGPREPAYSMLLVRPFIACLRLRAASGSPFLDEISAFSDDRRIPVESALRWLDGASALDCNFGLRAAQAWEHGTGDVLEHAASTAATLGDALRVVFRYIRMLNEAANFSLDVRDDVARIDLRSTVRLPRAEAGFQMATLMLGVRKWLGSLSGFEISFAHAAPADLTVYTQTFAQAVLRFTRPCDSISFGAHLLTRAVPSSDPDLHKVLIRYADIVARNLADDDSLAPRVRKVAVELMVTGDCQLDRVASSFRMSRRTLTRHLEAEGTSFKRILEDTRHQLALQYLERSNVSMQEIAFLLGYSITAAFSRAFQRWEGRSPASTARPSVCKRLSSAFLRIQGFKVFSCPVLSCLGAER